MQEMLSKVSIPVNNKIFLKDPDSSELGQRIISASIAIIDDLGFDKLTFRRLGSKIDSPEASIYRYFENNHKLLLYLTSWYWGWMEYNLVFRTANIQDPEDRLKSAVQLFTEQEPMQQVHAYVDVKKLYRIVISESSKSYLTKQVDDENKDGAFLQYKQLVGRVSDIVLEINPDYKYPHMLISTVIEGAHLQRYFAAHLPRLTDSIPGEDSIVEFYMHMVFTAISNNQRTIV